jgi:hypothetical protein
MGVFTPNTATDLGVQARKLASNFFGTRPLTITPAEFIDGFIDPEHVPTLRQTEDICGRIGNTSATTIELRTSKRDTLSLTVTFHGESPIIIPNYVSNGLRPGASPELRKKVQDWVDERWNYGCMFGDVYDAIEYYNVVCGDAKAFTVMLPILPTLMRNITVEADSRTSKRAKRLSELKGVNSLPSLPRTVTKAVLDACHLMTAVNLIETVETPKMQDGDAIISFSNVWNTPKRISLFAGLGHWPKARQGSFL